jgi:microcin C transport system ATP-binding protein
MAMLFITHDLGIVRKMADRVCVMTKGEIVEQGPGGRSLRRPQHSYTRICSRPSRRAARPRPIPPPEVLRLEDLKVLVPDQAAASCAARSAT